MRFVFKFAAKLALRRHNLIPATIAGSHFIGHDLLVYHDADPNCRGNGVYLSKKIGGLSENEFQIAKI